VKSGDQLLNMPDGQLVGLSRQELLTLVKAEREARVQITSREKETQQRLLTLAVQSARLEKAQAELKSLNETLTALNEELKQRIVVVEGQLIKIKAILFRKKSSVRPKKGKKKKTGAGKDKIQKPSERYPHAGVIEQDITLEELPPCPCCEAKMEDSGMIEESEYLTTKPKEYWIIRQKRHKYRCRKCYGAIVTAPMPPRIKEGSTYSDEMMVDIALTKYCDLVPIERYSSMAGREGLDDLPPHSLIECTHYLADFVRPSYERLKEEVMRKRVLHADETPHRMLEGDPEKKSWYLWGFSTTKCAYYEIHGTRAGTVATEVLKDSIVEYLMSDVFSGYKKAVRIANELRQAQGKALIKNIYCNAHSVRNFRDAGAQFEEEAKFFGERYGKIYDLEEEVRDKPPDQVLEARSQMKPLFEEMKDRALERVEQYPNKSEIAKAMRYLTNNYEGLTLFMSDPALPIDNNPQERLMRNPVVGRKTWYGTHSKRGAETAAILFSLVESCKLNKVNPREYFKRLIQLLHQGLKPIIPNEM